MLETFPCGGGCGRTLKRYPHRKTDLCRRCSALAHTHSPESKVKRSYSMKRKFRDPEFAQEHARRTAEGKREMLARDPAAMERLREAGRVLAATGLGHAAQRPGSEPRVLVGRQNTDRRLGWCPEHLRDLYRQLVRSKGYTGAEARAFVENEMERARAQRGKPKTFEQQLRAVQAGAGLVEKFKPSTNHDFTLGGVATGML
jgi:hypothetical protein